MSDTTTPSAAEVMGWSYWDTYDEDGSPLEGYGPTPDDMLTFLRAGGFFLAYVTTHDDGCRLELITSPARDDGKVPRDYEAPTLHAALEQAVIAVGRGL